MRKEYQNLKNKISSFLNEHLYESKEKAQTYLRTTQFIAAILGLIIILYCYGFELSDDLRDITFKSLDYIFAVFFFCFVIRWLYSFERIEFIKTHKTEAIIMLVVFINGFSSIFFANNTLQNLFRDLGFPDYLELYRLFVSIFMALLLLFEFIRLGSLITRLKVKPSVSLTLGFLILILAGTGLLMLPAMTTEEGGMYWLDALFTATSASCITGLIVVDTGTFFTTKGQVVIMILIQLGGIGIVAFAGFFSNFLRSGIGIQQQLLMKDTLGTDSLQDSYQLLRQVFIITFSLEAIIGVLIFFSWPEEVMFNDLQQKLFFTLFHTISAFCNAGFTFYGDSLATGILKEAYLLHIVIGIAIFLGAMGFATITEVFSIEKLRDRMKNPWKDWKISTKIAVYTHSLLLIVGAIFIFLIEYKNGLNGFNTMEKIIASFFQSVNRTSGFNSVDISLFGNSTLIVIIILMFIGGNSGSFSGGIKTSTFYLITVSVFESIRGRKKITIGNRYIPKELVFKALSIFFFASSANLLGIFILNLTDPNLDFVGLLFEQVSAFATVGYSLGITDQLSELGKSWIILSMFIGRVGTLTFALALATRESTENFKYPKANLMIG
ncbi:MAG: ATPase [Cyclobacteriaceae bacterium]|nr:ATPase [Cyclobacteriaceae bacterium]